MDDDMNNKQAPSRTQVRSRYMIPLLFLFYNFEVCSEFRSIAIDERGCCDVADDDEERNCEDWDKLMEKVREER